MNGDFESSAIGVSPAGWTVTNHQNFGITDLRPSPQTFASLALQSGGTLNTVVVGGATESQADPHLGAGASFRYPRFGTRAGVVNYDPAGAIGNNYNANVMRQTMTAALGDVDPVDNEVHVRFTVAPVLENPGHSYREQPYYYVELRNITRGTTLYQDFNTSAQPGVPWKISNGIYYTDWQLVDIAPGSAALAVGDQVELVVVAAGCSQSGHWGRVYVDGVSSAIPGIYTWASGPQLANAGTDVTYVVNYRNGGSGASTNTVLAFETPPNTTFRSVSLGSPTCTSPAVGATGMVNCSLGTLAPGSTSSFTVTVRINAGTAAGTVINAGNYSIDADVVSPLLGPKVQTTVTSGGSFADVSLTKTDSVAALTWGSATSYTVTVTNAGPNAAPSVVVADTMPAQLTGVTWVCAAAGGATCTASGSGNINDTASLPVGGTATYTISANIIAGSGPGSVSNTASATVGGGVTDPDTSNNAAADTTALGSLRTLSLTKTGALGGSVISTPAAINCGTSCSAASTSFLDGSTVILTASAVPNATFTGWGGACSGTSPTCTLTISANTTVTATFVPPPTVSATGGATQSTMVGTAFGSPLDVTVTDSNGTPLSGVTVTFAVPGVGASAVLSSATAVTNASGVASVTASANTNLGTYNVTASVPGSSATFALTNLVGAATSFGVNGGGSQSTLVNTAFGTALSVLVMDAYGHPISGQSITFAAPGSGASASLSGTTVTTNASGIATVTATANTTAGSYTVTASTGSLPNLSFLLSNNPGAVSTATVDGGSPQSTIVNTAFASPLLLTVRDQYGNPLSGVSVTFTPPVSGARATLSQTTLSTNALGRVSVTATANTVAGSYLVSASVAGLGTPRTFALTNLPGAVTSFAVTGGGTQSTLVNTAFAAPLEVRLLDTFGNPVSGTTVTFAAPPTGASASLLATSVTTDATGRASTTATASTTAGAYSVQASTAGFAPIGFALTNVAGAPASVTVNGGDAQGTTVGTAFASALELTVRDQYGNALSGVAVSFSVPGAGASASLSQTSLVTDAAGHVSVTATANTAAGAYVVNASVAGIAGLTPFALTNIPGVPAQLALVGGGTQQTLVNTAFPSALSVRITDAFGNPLGGESVTFDAPLTGASAVLGTQAVTTDAAGIATLSVSANVVAGSYVVHASSGSLAALDFFLTNDADAPALVTLDAPTAQATTVDTAFGTALGLTVRDQYGNPLSGVAVTFGGPGSGASALLSSASVMTDASGHASITATANTVAGVYDVVANVAGIASSFAFDMTNVPGAPAHLDITAGGTQTTTVDDAFGTALTVRITDTFGNPIAGENVTFSFPATSASAVLSATSVTTDANGVASVTATANTVAGAYDVTANAASLPAVQFALTNEPDAPATIRIDGGAAQMAIVEEAFGDSLSLTVLDVFGNPLPGVTVTFAAPGMGATAVLSSTTGTTDGDGHLAITAAAGTISGAYQVSASVVGVAEPAIFALVNLVSAPSEISVLGGGTQATEVDTAFADPLSVLVTDAHGNPVPDVTVTFTFPSSGATAVLSAVTATTDASGHASVTATAGTVSGAYEVTAATPVSMTPATFSLTNEPGAAFSITTSLSSSPQAAMVGTPFANPLVVTVLDAFGNVVPGAEVVFTVPSSGPTAELEMVTVLTDENGVASIDASASTLAGAYVVTATTAGVTTPATFALENLVGPPTTVSVVSGGSQRALATTEFEEPVVVEVLDVHGNPVVGVVITLTFPTTGASASTDAVQIVTDASGRASVVLVANALPGAYEVAVTVMGAATPALLSLANDVVETVTTLVVDHENALLGGRFELTATVRGSVGTPSGSVRFMAGDVELGSVILDENGVAVLRVDALVVGATEIVAEYVPDLPYVAGTSSPVTINVLPGGLSGGAVCSASPGASRESSVPWLLLGLAVLLAGRRGARRRIAGLRGLVGVATLVMAVGTASLASAQDAIAVDQFRTTPSPRDGFAISRPTVLGHLDYAAQLTLDYALNPLVYEIDPGDAGSERYSVVRHQLVGAGTISLGLFDRLMVYAIVPASLVMRGDAPSFDGLPTADGTRMGDPVIGGRAMLIGGEATDVFTLGTQLALSIPLARLANRDQRYAGDRTAVFIPKLLAEIRASRIRVNLELGARLRGVAHAESLDVGQELTYGAGVTLALIPDRLEAIAEIYGATTLGQDSSFGRANTPLEVLAGVKYFASECWTVGGALGTGLMRGYGAPDLRAVATVGYMPHCNVEAPAAVEPVAAEPSPEPVAEPVAEPIVEPEPAPPADTDGDGLLDAVDQCPSEPEDRDEIADEDGCPETDADADAVLDPADSCPTTAGVANAARPDCSGCPAHTCVTSAGAIEILTRVEFETNSDVILAESDEILTEVARILATNEHIRRVRVEGHTDDRGNDAHNLDLSERRAASVVRFMIAHGIDAARLESHGYGETRPLREGRTAEARSANRRVEFHIVDPAPEGGNDQTISR